VVVNVSLRSYIIHHDRLWNFHAQITREKGEKINNIHNVVSNKMTEFNHEDVFMDALRVYMVVNASLRSHIIHQNR
jgi:hypothetical protein